MQTARGDWTGYSHTDRCPTKQSRRLSRRRGGDLSSAAEPAKVLFKTRRGLHLQFDPEPSLDRWISCEVQYNAKTKKYTTQKGELNAAQQATYEQYQHRHRARCRVGDVADKLTRIVDKYLPKVADENRVFIMRFPNKAFKLLKKARRIRRRIKAETRGDMRERQVKTPAGGVQKQRARKEKSGRSSRWGTSKQETTEENAVPDPVPPPQKQGRLSQRVTNEREEDSPPDWGDDLPDTMAENVEPPAAMVPPVEDNSTSTWPWGKDGRPSDQRGSHGILAQRPNEPKSPPRRPSQQRGDVQLLSAVQQVQAHMARGRAQRGLEASEKQTTR